MPTLNMQHKRSLTRNNEVIQAPAYRPTVVVPLAHLPILLLTAAPAASSSPGQAAEAGGRNLTAQGEGRHTDTHATTTLATPATLLVRCRAAQVTSPLLLLLCMLAVLAGGP